MRAAVLSLVVCCAAFGPPPPPPHAAQRRGRVARPPRPRTVAQPPLTRHAGLLDMFGDDGPDTALGKGVTVAKVQVAVQCAGRGRGSVLGNLGTLGERDCDSARGLSSLVAEVSLELLRRCDDWVGGASSVRTFKGGDAEDQAESAYNRMVTSELAKFDKEYVSPPDVEDGGPTLAVVSVLVAIRGDKTAFEEINGSLSRCKTALETVAADVVTDRGDLLIAAEVLWTPSDATESLTKRDMLSDYPEILEL